jgi:hypothetical protein
MREEAYLEHVTQNTQHAVETSILLVSLFPLNASHHLSYEDKINNERRSQERVLADVEERNGLVPTHEDLRIVLVQSTLIVTYSRHVLDDNAVIRVFTLFIKDTVGSNHIIDNVGLGNFLGAELPLGAQVLAIIVSEMVVACNRGELDTSADEEVDQSRLHLGLARLEVVTSDEGLVLLSELNGAWDKGILGRAVDEGGTFKDTGDGKDGGRSNLLVTALDSLQEVVSSVVDAVDELSKSLGVSGPLNDDLLKVVSSLEVAIDVLVL